MAGTAAPVMRCQIMILPHRYRSAALIACLSLSAAILAGCATDEPPAPVREHWVLTSLDGTPPGIPITFGFADESPVAGEPVHVSGSGPCTAYQADFEATGATQRLVNIRATTRGCAQSPTEMRYLGALSLVTRMTVSAGEIGFVGSGHELRFRRAP